MIPLDKIRPYLNIVFMDVFSSNSEYQVFYYENPNAIKYKIIFYKANELDVPRTYISINTIDDNHNDYCVISDDIVIYEDNCKLSNNIKDHIDRLIKLSYFL
jgi:hypothetical protein